MTRKAFLSVLFVAVVSFATLVPAGTASAQSSGSFTNIPVAGTLAGGAFNGALSVTRFAVQNGQLVARGTLSGTLSDLLGNTIGSVTNVPVTLPLASITGSCEILHLVLGPLDLNLLGLMVHLDQVVLDISAQAVPGNLLGNLLCDVAHLLDKGGPLTGLANLLNHILRVVG